MSSTLLRPAAETDVAAITEIYADAVLHGAASYEIEPPAADEMMRRFRSLVGRGFPYLVADVDGAVAGYAYAGPFRERPAYRYVVENSVYVTPRAKGRGIGRRLLDRLIEETAARGYRQMIAVIGDGGDHSASVKLHEAAGFSHAGKITGSGFKHGRWLDTVIMQLAMNGGTATLPK
ncbi:MAG: N-acetyltransferase family protein [Rhizobiaceae bacterium]